MATLVTVPQQSYAVGTYTFKPTLASSRSEIKFSLTKVAWPSGPCLQLSFTFPDGTSAGSMTFDGGASLDRAGFPQCHGGLRAPGGKLPAGQYTIVAEVLQTITTAVTVQDA